MRKLAITLTLFLICGVQIVFAQKVVTGKVTDANDGTSLPGVNVSIKGTNLGTTTGATGEYSLRIPANAKILVYSFVGYDKQEVPVQSTSVINVQLKVNSQTLDEIVITAMGVKRPARSIGASSTNITSGDLIQSKPVNAVTGLTGKVSGLMINLSDNSVNPQVRIELRGNRHITGNNQALVVLDGVIVDPGVLVRINPNDIESSNVLKGASAAAIYGSDASNGVMVITTKKGASSKKSQITLSSTLQFETVSLMPNLQNNFGSYGGETPDLLLGMQFPSDPTKYYFPYENQSFGPAFNGQKVPLGGPVRIYRANGTFYDSTKMVPYSAVNNGKRDFFNTGITFQKDLSIASGEEGSQTFFSYQNVSNSGIVPKDKYERNAFRFNSEKQINSYLKLAFTTSYTSRKYDQVGGSYFQNRPVYWTVINAPQQVNLNDYKNWKTDPFASPDGYYNAYYSNPWWQIDQSRNTDVRNDFVGNIKTSVDFTSWLSASWSIGYVRGDERNKATKAGYQFAAWAVADPWQAGTIPSSQKLLLPSMNEQMIQDAKLSSDLLLTFKKKFKDISTQLILGNSVWKRTTNNQYDLTNSLSMTDLYNIGYIQGIPTATQETRNWGLIGYFADISLSYKNFLFLHGSGRYDESSLLAKGNRNFFYPGADASFVFTDAFKGLSDLSWLSFGKVRAAITKVGSVSVDPYALNTNANPYGGFPYGSTIAYGLSTTFGNSNLKPEFTNEKELGLEFGLFRNKINFTATYYNSLTTNQTIYASLSAATGFLNTISNIGQMSNKGVELDLNFLNIFERSEFKVNFGINYAYNRNEVLGLTSGDIALSTSSPGIYASNGNPYPYLKGSDFVRDTQGHIVVDANTGYPSTAQSNSNYGTTNPPTKIGMNLQVTYKGFTLRAVADGRFGAVIYNNIGSSLDFTGISANSASRNRQPFIIPNSVIKQSDGSYKPNTDVLTKDGNWTFWANTWNNVYSSYVNSADFWKIREISLTYSLPKSIITSTFKNSIQGVSIVLSGRNLFTFRAKDNIWSDPEFSNSGSGNALGYTNVNQTPPTRIIGATLNVVF